MSETNRAVIAVGPGYLDSALRRSEEVLNGLGEYFIDGTRKFGGGLVVKVYDRSDPYTFSYAKATREKIKRDLDSHAEFIDWRDRFHKSVFVPSNLPAQILRRARFERSDTPFPDLEEN